MLIQEVLHLLLEMLFAIRKLLFKSVFIQLLLRSLLISQLRLCNLEDSNLLCQQLSLLLGILQEFLAIHNLGFHLSNLDLCLLVLLGDLRLVRGYFCL